MRNGNEAHRLYETKEGVSGREMRRGISKALGGSGGGNMGTGCGIKEEGLKENNDIGRTMASKGRAFVWIRMVERRRVREAK